MIYKVKCQAMAVVIHVPEELMSQVKELTEPYFLIEECDAESVTDDLWQISFVRDLNQELECFEKFTMETDVTKEVSYYLSRPRKTVLAWSKGMSETWIAQTILRLVRVIFRLKAMEGGELFAHGGLITIKDRGLAIIGDKRAGKTTTILSCLKKGAAYLTNDDVSFQIHGHTIKAFGWPRSISVRGDTLKNTVETDRIHEYYRNLSHPENDVIRHSNFQGSEPNGLTFFRPRELADMFRAPIQTSCELSAILFPEFAEDRQQRPTMTRLSPVDGLSLLRKNLVRNPGKYNEFLLSSFKLEDPQGTFSQYEHLFRKIPMYSLKQGFLRTSMTYDCIARFLL